MQRREIRVSSNFWRVWKVIAIALALIGLTGWIWNASIWYQYQATLPRQSNPATGNIYPLNVHGIGVYMTRQERNWLDETEYTSFTLAAIGVLMGAIYEKKFKGPSSNRPGQIGSLKL